jgi:hypothetical protein
MYMWSVKNCFCFDEKSSIILVRSVSVKTQIVSAAVAMCVKKGHMGGIMQLSYLTNNSLVWVQVLVALMCCICSGLVHFYSLH